MYRRRDKVRMYICEDGYRREDDPSTDQDTTLQRLDLISCTPLNKVYDAAIDLLKWDNVYRCEPQLSTTLRLWLGKRVGYSEVLKGPMLKEYRLWAGDVIPDDG